VRDAVPTTPDPRVSDVAGGDEWNRATAARLEAEYTAAISALHDIAEKAPTQETTANAAPQEWNDLASTTQSDAESAYAENNYSNEYDNEVNNWQEGGDPQAIVAQDLQHNDEWKQEKLADYLAELQDNDKPSIPYSPEDLADAIQFTAAGPEEYQNGSTTVDPLVQFNKDALQNPTDINTDAHNPDQGALPGIAPQLAPLQDHLTQAMRDGLVAYFIKEFNDEVEKKSGDVTPPDYLGENVKESLADAWSQMDDTEKYSWTKQNTSLIDDEPSDNSPHSIELPAKFDPLNETSGEDYTRTQAIAKYMADTRAAQIMADRGIKVAEVSKLVWDKESKQNVEKLMGGYPVSVDNIQAVDEKLWSGWKGSSTGSEGLLLQVASADELGGRSRNAPPQSEDKTTVTVGGMIVKAPTDKAIDDLLEAKTTLANEKSSVQEMKDALTTVDNYVTTHGAAAYITKDLALQTSFEWAKALIKTNAWGDKFATLEELDKAKGVIAMYEKAALASDNQKPGSAPSYVPAPSTVINHVAYMEFAKSKVAQTGTLPEFEAAIKASVNPVALSSHIKADKDMSFEQKQIAQKFIESAGPPMLRAETVSTNANVPDHMRGPQNDFTLLPDLKLTRNGAASFTTDRSVANNWGGTSNYATRGINREDVIAKANEEYKAIGGYEGVKAAIRAKWETTQYMLDKADKPSLELYRGINMPHLTGKESVGTFNPPSSGKVTLLNGGEVDLANATVGTQYHIASGKTITKVSEDPQYKTQLGKWQYGEPERPTNRVVIRAEVPRTAVLSVPAYGVNVHSEHEVVVTGTAWHHWDAYSERAPDAADIPVGSRMVRAAGVDRLRPPDNPNSKLGVGPEPPWEAQTPDIVAKHKAKIPKEQQL
jgi:hypothetical protein